MRLKVQNLYYQALSNSRSRFKLFYLQKGNTFNRFPLLMESKNLRDKILFKLNSEGIGASLMYPYVLNRQPGLSEILNDKTEYPAASQIVETMLTLPINEYVTEEVIEKIANTLYCY